MTLNVWLNNWQSRQHDNLPLCASHIRVMPDIRSHGKCQIVMKRRGQRNMAMTDAKEIQDNSGLKVI